MGGNALKNTKTRRYQANEYFALCEEVLGLLENAVGDYSKVVPAYRAKDSFGDMDVLTKRKFRVDDVKTMFNPNEVVKNGDVISFDYKEFQVDLVYSSSHKFKYALSYFSYNDLGNLVGKLARQFGLKHGHDGLLLPVRDGNHLYEEILVTNDHDETLAFLGLDVDRFDLGFDTQVDLFEYVASSPYFNPEKYKLENLSHTGRVRDKKRDTYQKFLEWLKTYNGPVAEMNNDKSFYLDRVFSYFPQRVEREYNRVAAEVALKRQAARVFNGTLVGEWTSKEGKELGELMQVLRKDIYYTPTRLVFKSQETVKQYTLDKVGELKFLHTA